MRNHNVKDGVVEVLYSELPAIHRNFDALGFGEGLLAKGETIKVITPEWTLSASTKEILDYKLIHQQWSQEFKEVRPTFHWPLKKWNLESGDPDWQQKLRAHNGVNNNATT